MVHPDTPYAAGPVALLCLTVVLGACAADGTPTPTVVAETEPASVSDRFAVDESENGTRYSAVVPRASVPADAVASTAPESYTVVKGDTLWDISGRFLNEPWLWPRIWDYNPQIENPHLIYPGDQIALEYINGRPTIVISRNGERVAGAGYTRLSPRVRVESLDQAIPMIPGDAIRAFLVHPRVVPLDSIENAPYVVGNYDNRLISAVGHKVYARGTLSGEQTNYGIFRRNKALNDPVTGELLGYEVNHVADAKLLNRGDPATLGITRNRMETIAGDVLLPSHLSAVSHTYLPRMPAIDGDGRIVSLVNAISQTGRDQVVVLNLGERSGVQIGDVLAIEARGSSLIDRRGKHGFERVVMPNIRTGVAMVFQTYDKVSYALVMESTRPVSVNDVVTGI